MVRKPPVDSPLSIYRSPVRGLIKTSVDVFPVDAVEPPAPENVYFRPDGISLYFRPDGESLYLRPE